MNVREQESAVIGAIKAAPPVAISGMTVWGYPISDWLVVMTLLYTAVQLGITINGAIQRRRRRSEACGSCEHGGQR